MAVVARREPMLGRGIPGRAIRGGLAILIVAALATAYVSLNFFFYFTVLSNILAAVLFAGQAARPDWMSSNGGFRGAVTLYMVITGLVYGVLLRPIEADVGITDHWVNWVLHSLGPVAVLIDWLLFSPERPLATSILWTWLILPAAYLAISLVRGPIADWYPYPFLDPAEAGGYRAVALWSLLILLFFVGVGTFLRWWANARGPMQLAAARLTEAG